MNATIACARQTDDLDTPRRPIRIAVDLDGVLTEHPRPLALAANRAFGLDLPPQAFVDSAGLNVPLEVRQWVYGPDGPARLLRPADGAQEALRTLLVALGGEQVRIITARPAAARELTLAWLERHGFPACELICADDKVAVARRLGVTHAIEDSRRHAQSYAAAGITCLLLGPGPHPIPAGPGNVVPVSNLNSAVDYMLQSLQALQRLNDQAQMEEIVLERIHRDRPDGMPTAADEPRYRIVVSDVIDAHAREVLSREAEMIDVDGRDPVALAEALRCADALIVRSETMVTPEVLAAGPRLRLVARAGVGVDNIDVPSATAAGILVLNAPGANAVSAGEHTIALLLAIARCVPVANAGMHAGRWERKQLKPFDLQGKTLGIVGLGRVGSVVARRLRAFEMRLIGYDPYVAPERFEQLGVEPVCYERLLAEADVVTYHVPATPETIDMLDEEAIARLKPGAIVLNCARGEIVDIEALAEALRDGRVAAAGVDVHPEEPASTSPLFGLPNVILTPHIGGSSREALAAVGEVISTTTLAALRGEAVPNAVNLPPASLNAPELRRLTRVAGAAGRLLAVLQPERPACLSLRLRGVVARDVTERVLAAALSEALPRWGTCGPPRRVTPVNARLVADELGLQLSILSDDPDPGLTPEFAFEVGTSHSGHAGDARRVTLCWDPAKPGIVEVDRFRLERPLSGDLLITRHQDRPGIVGQVGTILGRYAVNIAGMQVGRLGQERGGQAIMVLNVDDAIPEPALAEILMIPDVESAYVVSLPHAEPPASVAAPSALSVAS